MKYTYNGVTGYFEPEGFLLLSERQLVEMTNG